MILRPNIKEFIKFILEYFDHISIWSAGTKRYVRAIESIIFSPDDKVYKEKCSQVLSRKDCNKITKTSVLKDISTKGFDLKNTLIIDDNHTTLVNNPDNGILIPAYEPELNKNHIFYEDKCLLELIEWFKKK